MEKPPPNFWATLIAFAALALSALSMLVNNKTNIEQRICRIESAVGVGECKR